MPLLRGPLRGGHDDLAMARHLGSLLLLPPVTRGASAACIMVDTGVLCRSRSIGGRKPVRQALRGGRWCGLPSWAAAIDASSGQLLHVGSIACEVLPLIRSQRRKPPPAARLH